MFNPQLHGWFSYLTDKNQQHIKKSTLLWADLVLQIEVKLVDIYMEIKEVELSAVKVDCTSF